MRAFIHFGTAAVALLALSWPQSGIAQATCGNIEFSQDITSRYPNARAACVDIVEREGKPYAHFKAEIVAVRGNNVEVKFKAPDGTTSRTIAFNPPSDARVRIQGSTYRYSELSRGQELDLYLPPDRWAIAVHQDPTVTFAAAPSVEPVALTEPTQQLAAATLPATAGTLPWLVLLGTFLIALGGIIAIRTTRVS